MNETDVWIRLWRMDETEANKWSDCSDKMRLASA